MVDFQYIGVNPIKFEEEFKASFAKNPRFNSNAIPAMLKLVDMLARDPKISDVRWAAYILATVMWETTSPTTVEVPAKNKKGQPLRDKQGNQIMLKQKKWLMTMAPVDEVGHGAGRNYHEPVKIAVLADGSVRVTEQDGDQFSVSTTGKITPLARGAKMGSPSGGTQSQTYQNDTGSEQAFYGRGYVQLTWWSNYAKAGVAIGKGLDLLKNPELVKDPPVAYALMSHGMVTGEGFANGHKFADFFSGQNRNYAAARKMVNGTDHKDDIAELAKKFEKVLLESCIRRGYVPIDSALEGPPRFGRGPGLFGWLLPAALALCLGLALAPAMAEAPETRCGWFDNPTPGNASLHDREGEWTVAVQGGHQAEGDWPPAFRSGQWIRRGNGNYGYGCACLVVRVDREEKNILAIVSGSGRPLSACRKDKAIAGAENNLR